jgi:hypothetical protein
MRQTKEKQAANNYITSFVNPFLETYTKQMTRPVQKFLHQMLYGIIKSHSVIVQRIAVSLGDSIRLKKSCERLYRNLAKCTVLHELLMDAQIRQLAVEIKQDSAIVIDLSDINKSGANKMEGLADVWDGSQSKTNKGYFTLQASLCHHSNPKEVRLLYSDIFSLEKEDTSENQKILDLTQSVMINADNRGIFVMDRGMDRMTILKDLIQNEASFIIRGDKRHLIYNDREMSYLQIAEQVKLKYEVKSKNRIFPTGVVPVQLVLSNDEDNKNQRKSKADLFLVVAKEQDRGYVYYLCRFRHAYSGAQMVSLVIKYYGLRWSIEEVHRQIKHDFNWEDIQLLNYYSLKNMNALLWLAASFIYNKVTKITNYLIKIFPERLLYRQLSIDVKKNLMYRLTALVRDLFAKISPFEPRKHPYGKAVPSFFENDQICLFQEGY